MQPGSSSRIGRRTAWLAGLALAAAVAAEARQAPPPPPPPLPVPIVPQVERPQQPQGTGAISGVVVVADSGHPLDGVRLNLSGSEIRGSRSAYTDDDGRFAFAGLPPGSFTLSASRTGYVAVVYGQRQPGPGRSGTPIQLVEGQRITDIKLSIPKGGVITGVVFDEKGRPSVGTSVRVSRWAMNNGERRLVSAGAGSTDDRGIYRVFGLAPGPYIVNAIPRNRTVSVVSVVNGEPQDAAWRIEALQRVEAMNVLITSGGTVAMTQTVPAERDDSGAQSGYAPVYYPGTLDISAAQPVDLGVSEEKGGINLNLQQVPLADVHGQLLIPPGVNMSNVRVRLMNTAVNVPGVGTPSARAGRDGAFVFRNVAPGQYRAIAVANVRNVPPNAIGAALGGEPLPPGNNTLRFWAATELSVFGRPVSGVTLVMQPGMIVSGRVAFEASSRPPPENLSRVRVTLAPVASSSETGVSSMSARLDEYGAFRFVGVVPGEYRIRTSVAGWWPKTAMAGGRDALDFLLTVPEQESVPNLMITMTDRSAGLSGTLQDAMSQPTADYTVVLFSADSRFWLPQSRRIRATRPATDGRFAFDGLPAGDYRLAAVTDVETGIWYDPEFLRQLLGASVPVQLGDGEQRVQNLRVAGR